MSASLFISFILNCPKLETIRIHINRWMDYQTVVYLWKGIILYWASLLTQMVKNPPAIQETWVRSLGQEDPLEQGKATHSSIWAWRIPWTAESMESQRVRHDWVTLTHSYKGMSDQFTQQYGWLTYILLSGNSQSQEAMCCMIPFMQHFGFVFLVLFLIFTGV